MLACRMGVGCCLALFTLLSFAQADVSVVSVVPVIEANFQGGVDSGAIVPEGTTPHAVTGSHGRVPQHITASDVSTREAQNTADIIDACESP